MATRTTPGRLAGRLRCAAFTAPPTTCGVTKSKPVPRTFHPVRVAAEYVPGGSVTSRNTPSGESRSTRRSPSAIGSSGGLGGGVMSPFTVSRSSPGGVPYRPTLRRALVRATPSTQASNTSHTPSPSTSTRVWVQVPPASQASVVQTWPLSGHGVPAARGVCAQLPPASQASVVQKRPSSAHGVPETTGVCAHVPAPSHASVVQAFWSSKQLVPAPSAGCVHVPVALHTSSVHGFASAVQLLPLARR